MFFRKIFIVFLVEFLALHVALAVDTIYVDNIKGNDTNAGTDSAPVASIEQGLKLLKTSGRLEIAPNNGKPYRRPYSGPVGKNLDITVGGSPEVPVVIEGNGAVISGLAEIPATCWQNVGAEIYSLPFWPMSNFYKKFNRQDYWIPGLQIFFVNREPVPTLKSREEMENTPGGWWWSRKDKSIFYHLPQKSTLKDLKIELPASCGFYFHKSYAEVRNCTVILSWNDGFDSTRDAQHCRYVNCVAVDNCGQGFSCHGTSQVDYIDCVAIRNGSAGCSNVHSSTVNYERCIFYNNLFEGGVFGMGKSVNHFRECLLMNNQPFEQIWGSQNSKMIFENCVVADTTRRQPLIKMDNLAQIEFSHCTLTGGSNLLRLRDKPKGSVKVSQSIAGNTSGTLLQIIFGPAGGRVQFQNNLFYAHNGIRILDKLYKPEQLADTGLDTGSIFKKVLPVKNKIPSAENGTGAVLPVSVWERFKKYQSVKTGPDGISFPDKPAVIDLNQKLNQMRKKGLKSLVLPDGDIFIAKPIALNSQFNDTEIRGGKNTRLINTNRTSVFELKGCVNVQLRNFAMDYAPLMYTQGTIEKIVGEKLYVRLHDGYPDLEDRYQNRHPDFFDAETRKYKWPSDENAVCLRVDRTSEREAVILFNSPLKNIRVGDFAVFDDRGSAVVSLSNLAANITLENLTIHSGGIDVLGRCCDENIIVKGCRVIPGPRPVKSTQDRLMATCADGFNFGDCRGKITIENCETNAIGDDSVNLHGLMWVVTERSAGRKMQIAVAGGRSPIVKLMRSGDLFRILDSKDYRIIAKGKIQSAKLLPNADTSWQKIKSSFPTIPSTRVTMLEITFEGAEPKVGSLIDFPALNSPDYKITGNHFHHHRARGLRLMADNGLIEKNHFEHLENAAIALGPEYAVWSEAGWCNNISVRNNIIRNVCLGGSAHRANAYVLGAIALFVRPAPLDVQGTNSNVQIENNQIDGCSLAGIYTVGVQNVLIRNNHIKNCATRKDTPVGSGYLLNYTPKAIGGLQTQYTPTSSF